MKSTLLLLVAAVTVAGSGCRLFDDSDAPCDAPEHCDVDETCLLGVCQCSNGDVDGDECVDLPDLAAVQQRVPPHQAAFQKIHPPRHLARPEQQVLSW